MNIILNENILFFFDKIYKEERKEEYNLNEFGLADLKFVFSKKVKLLEDLISKNKKDVQFNEYKKRIKECCDNYFKLSLFISSKFSFEKYSASILCSLFNSLSLTTLTSSPFNKAVYFASSKGLVRKNLSPLSLQTLQRLRLCRLCSIYLVVLNPDHG
jgi:hypothetical protein